MPVVRIVEEKHLARRMVGNCRRQFSDAKTHALRDKHDTTDNRHDKAKRFKRIRPNERLHPSLE